MAARVVRLDAVLSELAAVLSVALQDSADVSGRP